MGSRSRTWRSIRQIPNRFLVAVMGHPYGPNEERGVFLSTDGGKTYTKVLYKDENTGANDVEIDPKDPRICYAALWEARQGPWENSAWSGTNGGIFKSTDGGSNWTPLKNGLPEGVIQANLAIAASDPKRIYAAVATQQGVGIYRSDNQGEHWEKITSDERPAERIGGGDLPVPAVDPQNADVVYSASIVTWKSTDGGKTWGGLRGAPGWRRLSEHLDQPNEPQHFGDRQRSRRNHHRERRRNLEFLVQPADRADVSRVGRQCISLPSVRRPAGERFGVRGQPRQRWRDHLSRLASGGRRRVWICGGRSAQSGSGLRRKADAL